MTGLSTTLSETPKTGFVKLRPISRAIIPERVYFMGGSRGGTGGLNPAAKSQVAIGFLRNTSKDPLEV